LEVMAPVTASNLALNEINKTNTALADSKVNLRVESAGVVRFSMPTPITLEQAIKFAKKDLTILGARDAERADVVVVIHRISTEDGGVLAQPAKNPEDAFAVIHPITTRGTNYGYTHELGHLFGASHQDTGGEIYPSGSTGNWPDGQGYYYRHNLVSLALALPDNTVNPLGGDCTHTLMAYPPKNVLKGVDCTRGPSRKVLLFSNPNVCDILYTVTAPATPKSLCYGDSNHNNAYVVGQYGPTLTSFRNTKLRPRTVMERIIGIITSIGLMDP
jgi:Metallo-peptidase family M12B Reprolysin-like